MQFFVSSSGSFLTENVFTLVPGFIKIMDHGAEEYSRGHLQREYFMHEYGYIGILLMLVITLSIYFYSAFCLMKIAKKTNTPDAWMAFIPVFSFYLAVRIARKPGWWVLLLFVPFVNIFIGIIVGIEICKRFGYPPAAVILFLIPLVNFIFLGILAFSKNQNQIT